MRRYFLILLIPFFLLSCGESEKEKALQAKVDSLKAVTGADSQTINDYLKAFNEIQANLDEIKDREKIITSHTNSDGELGETDVTSINEDITAIYALMAENKDKLAYLKKKLRKSDSKMAQFQATIERLTAETTEKGQELEALKTLLEQKNVDIAQLNETVENLETDVEQLKNETTEKTETINEQDKALHTAYFVIANAKELKERKIITTSGGFIGIGGVKKINQNTEAFTEIDTRKVTEFELNDAKSVNVITSHSDDSYEFVMNGKLYSKLVVKNPDKFWSMSKYLVISTK